jgi:imidazolonepropionase-like amidohydrolase
MKNRDAHRKAIVLVALALAATASRAALPQGSAGSGVTVIKDATILTITQGNITKGSIVIRDGKIAELGPTVTIPAGATVIDAAGMFVMPGIIDAHNHIAIAGGTNEGSLAVTSMVGIEEVVDPTDIDIYRDLAGGVTTVHTLHGSANPIGGKNQLIKLRWGKDAHGLVFEGWKRPTLKFALGENPKRAGETVMPGATPRYPGSRMGVEDVIRNAFIEAQNYLKGWEDYRKRAAAGDKLAIPPRKNLEMETLAEVLRGERVCSVHAYVADEMEMFMRLADEFHIKVATFEHGLEGYKLTKELIAHGIGVTTFSDWWAYKFEVYDAIPYNAAIMVKKGVLVSINSDDAEESRHLNQEAAKCMKYGGLTEQEALALITINPAKQLGIEDRVGSLETGKDADLVIYNRHPLSIYAVPQKVLIDGQVYFDIQKDLATRAKMEQERKTLREQERKQQGGRGAETPQPATNSSAVSPRNN